MSHFFDHSQGYLPQSPFQDDDITFEGQGYTGGPNGGMSFESSPVGRQSGFPGGGSFGTPGGGQPGGSMFGGFPGGGPSGFPGGGFPSGFPSGFPGGPQQGGFPPGSGGGQQSGVPTSPPPAFTPQLQQGASAFAVEPGGIRRCLFRFTYVWLNNGRAFWFYPTFVGRTSIAGYRWRNFRWVYYGTDLNRIRSFQCGF